MRRWMIYCLATGAVLAGWFMLTVLAGERQRRLNELEVIRQVQESQGTGPAGGAPQRT